MTSRRAGGATTKRSGKQPWEFVVIRGADDHRHTRNTRSEAATGMSGFHGNCPLTRTYRSIKGQGKLYLSCAPSELCGHVQSRTRILWNSRQRTTEAYRPATQYSFPPRQEFSNDTLDVHVPRARCRLRRSSCSPSQAPVRAADPTSVAVVAAVTGNLGGP